MIVRSDAARDFKRCVWFKPNPQTKLLRPAFKSWLDYTAGKINT